jgi:3'(2'), 5'-bisphosphate nucleotidase
MSSFFTQKQIEKIVELAFLAGEIAKDFFNKKNFAINRKADNSPVTSADIEVSQFLFKNLSAEFPQITIICEEQSLRLISGDVFFIIDPIDGTSSFVKGEVEFAINIALIQNQKAVFGLIYAPLFEGGKMIFSNQKNEVVLQSGFLSQKVEQQILLQSQNEFKFDFKSFDTLKIITSPRTKDAQIEDFISQIYPEFSQKFLVERLSSAVKFFRLFEKSALLYLHFRPSMEWDTAAGQALVELMGGKLKKLFFTHEKFLISESLSYQKPDFLNSSFIAHI